VGEAVNDNEHVAGEFWMVTASPSRADGVASSPELMQGTEKDDVS
jgi:hypothetical protein